MRALLSVLRQGMNKLNANYTRLSNEILESLAKINLSPYEWRFLMVVFRKTYGFHKKADWIALSQIVEATGMHKSHVSRAKSKLLQKRLVTQTGNRIAFNKYQSQWFKLPNQVTEETVTQTGNDPPPKQVISLPKQAHTKETVTKEILQKGQKCPNCDGTRQVKVGKAMIRCGLCRTS